MASISVDHESARNILNVAWAEIDNPIIQPPQAIAALMEDVFTSKDVTFKYILLTGILAKHTNKGVHPRALQTSSSLVNSYDARSLCHGVIVPFEKTKGDLWGLSNEPFVNKPARHPEHSKDNPQLRNKTGASRVHDVLEFIHKANSKGVHAALVFALRLGKLRAESQQIAEIEAEISQSRVVQFVTTFLQESDGGTHGKE